MKIALAQLNPTIGDFKGNTSMIINHIAKARQSECDLIIFSEMIVTGYPPRDLLDYPHFIEKAESAIDEIAKHAEGIAVLVGGISQNPDWSGRGLLNSAFWLEDGIIREVFHKTLLPSYDVFDETRYFESSPSKNPIMYKNVCFGVTICEDIWIQPQKNSNRKYNNDPVNSLIQKGAEIILNISASPFSMGRYHERLKVIRETARNNNVKLIYVNQVGGNDELVFDGGSTVVNGNGDLLYTLKFFEEDYQIVDTDKKSIIDLPEENSFESLEQALVLGLGDYVRKCGFKKVVLGLSGGIDSALVAYLASKAVGADNVYGLLMPSRYSSDHSVSDSLELVKNLKINSQKISIEEIHKAYESAFNKMFQNRISDVTEENIQARIRGNLVMAVSNKLGYLPLTTGNKSEVSVGYATLYGDMSGGLAVISDVPKTYVYQLCHHINRKENVIPQNIINKVPSAELKPNQTDFDNLPPYEELDSIMTAYIENFKNVDEIIAMGFKEEVVKKIIRLIHLSEYKRRQAAPGLRVTSKAFGMGRRLPIAHKLDDVI